jgi:hypothetical protein
MTDEWSKIIGLLRIKSLYLTQNIKRLIMKKPELLSPANGIDGDMVLISRFR